jgi:hypothetical protein
VTSTTERRPFCSSSFRCMKSFLGHVKLGLERVSQPITSGSKSTGCSLTALGALVLGEMRMATLGMPSGSGDLLSAVRCCYLAAALCAWRALVLKLKIWTKNFTILHITRVELHPILELHHGDPRLLNSRDF